MTGHTPSQTIGPYFHIGLPFDGGGELIDPASPRAIRIMGQVADGKGEPVNDCMIELWQADAQGRYSHPGDPQHDQTDDEFTGFGRIHTNVDGTYAFTTCKPGPVAGDGNSLQAPHIMLSVFARGLLDRLVTRLYFGDEHQANQLDPLLNTIEDITIRNTLIAQPEDPAHYRFDIHLQGDEETAFFDI